MGTDSSEARPVQPARAKFKWLDFKITNRCNLKCTYCGVSHDAPAARELLTSGTVAKTLAHALRSGFSHFALLGGEPSLRADLRRIFASFRGPTGPKSLLVITNGVIFNEVLYRCLFESNAEEAVLVYSMDSLKRPNYKSQDPTRALECIQRIGRIASEYEGIEGVRRVAVHTVISRENFRDVAELVDTFRELGIEVSLGLVCPSRFVMDGEPSAYNEFAYSELESIVSQLNDLERSGHLSTANKILRDYLEEYPYGKLHQASDCKAGKQVVIINPDGEVFPCVPHSYLGGTRYGNVSVDSFEDILARVSQFVCNWSESPACWDHYLWDRLAQGSS